MRKILLALTAVTFGTAALHAQTRFTLYEEFSGENCGPCAYYNPGLWSLMQKNTNKVLLIKYQSPIPSAGPIYNAYKTITDARLMYYKVNSAPYGIQNGNEVKGNVASYTQSNINAINTATPFNLSVSHQWLPGDSVSATITINTPAAYSPDSGRMVLRVALIEHLSYCSAPGTNGESEFHNVVREMYPNAAGTPIDTNWAANTTKTFTISGKVPNRVDKSNDRAVIVVWIQNEANKNILQAEQSTQVKLAADASLKGCYGPIVACATGSVTVPTAVSLTNTGASTLTTATIYYKLDNGSFSSTTWTGSLAPGASTTASIPAVTMSVGNHFVYDSVDVVNGTADVNRINNVMQQNVIVRDATASGFPVSADFENGGQMPANWATVDENGLGTDWMPISNAGYNGSTYSLVHYNYAFSAGDRNLAILPGSMTAAGTNALDFKLAYAQFQSENDKLEVVYSTDCGASWTTIWSDEGASMATHTPVNDKVFVPADGDWKSKSIDVSAVPNGGVLAFRATSDYGNNLYIDNVNLRAGAATGVRNVAAAAADMKLYPNPAREAATLQFSLPKAGSVQVNVMDATGRAIAVIADGNMQAGAQRFNIPTTSLAAGMYQVVIRTEEGVSTQRLSVVK